MAKEAVLFLSKSHDPGSQAAAEICRSAFPQTEVFLGQWGDPFPASARQWEGDYIISYLSRWIVPNETIARARRAALNFHPGPPEYPGIGCNNFALYENASTYGATCHHMKAKVDSGDIVAVKRFNVNQEETVASLLEKTYDAQLHLFREIIGKLAAGAPLPGSAEKWSDRVGTRKALDELAHISPEMEETEIRRRIRATSFGKWQPYISLHGLRFRFDPNT